MSYLNKTQPVCNAVKGGKILLLILLVLIFPPPGSANPVEMEAPVDVQVPLFLKILTFDRKLKERFGDEIVLGIVYQEKFRKSLNTKNRFVNRLKKLPEKNIADIPFRYVSVPLTTLSQFKTALAKKKVDIIYITPLRAVAVGPLAAVSRSLGITSLTGVPGYCESGIAVSIGSKGGSPLIIINLPGALSEGADFSSQLLKLAKVIKKERSFKK